MPATAPPEGLAFDRIPTPAGEAVIMWDSELRLRVFDWAARVKQKWFINDGIHYTSPGYVKRTHLIARALAAAFPEGRAASAGCLV